MRTTLLFLTLCSCATPNDWTFFIGTWSGKSALASGQTTTLNWVVTSDGTSLNGKSEAPDFDMKATDQWRREGDHFVRDYSDTQGTKGLLTSAGWKKDVWIWEGTLTTADQRRVKVVETITRLDQHTMHARYEVDGAFESEETLTQK